MKKTLFFSFLSLICCISSYSSEEISYLNDNSTNLQQTSLNGEAKALAAWNKLKETFGYSHTASDSIEYPDYYGGSYIEDEKLIVYIVKGVTCTFHSNISPCVNLKNLRFSDFTGALLSFIKK